MEFFFSISINNNIDIPSLIIFKSFMVSLILQVLKRKIAETLDWEWSQKNSTRTDTALSGNWKH